MNPYGVRSVIKKACRIYSRCPVSMGFIGQQCAWFYRTLALNKPLLGDLLAAKSDQINTVKFIFTVMGERRYEECLVNANSGKCCGSNFCLLLIDW